MSLVLRKLKEEMRLEHPPYPPSKEEGILVVLPLGEGGLRGIVPKTFPSIIEIYDFNKRAQKLIVFNVFTRFLVYNLLKNKRSDYESIGDA